MLQRDYIMRLIQEFMAALERLLEKKEGRERQEMLEQLYRQYLDDYTFYHTSSIDEVMGSFTRYPEDERVYRMEMLAELYYVEAEMRTGTLREGIQQRALSLFDFIDRHSGTYSQDRLTKMGRLRTALYRTNSKGAKPENTRKDNGK